MQLRKMLNSSSSQILILVAALFLLIAITGFITPAFLTYRHLTTILYANTMLGILAIAQTLVIISGGLDMSVGSIYWISITVGAVMMGNSEQTAIPVVFCLFRRSFLGL